MLAVDIPEQAKPLIERLAVMPKEEFEAFRNALSTAPPNLRLETLNEEVKKLLLEKFPKIAELVDIITGLSRSPRDASVTVEELAASVAAAVLKRKGQQPPDTALLESRLAALLGIPSLKLWAKASDVQHQYEEIFFGARIISDIRTVFESDGVKPLGAMVVHNLEITSGRGGYHQLHDRFFALDNKDLEILQQVIERAKAKTLSLEHFIKQSQLTYFESK
jgi:hypothetical protein